MFKGKVKPLEVIAPLWGPGSNVGMEWRRQSGFRILLCWRNPVLQGSSLLTVSYIPYSPSNFTFLDPYVRPLHSRRLLDRLDE